MFLLIKNAPPIAVTLLLSFVYLLSTLISALQAQQLEPGFTSELVVNNMLDPASFEFAPDGRLFYGERITGALRVAKFDTMTGVYIVNDTAFYSFDVPASQHRSSGLRGFAFDPNYDSTGYIYAFYMKDNPRHNRVVRIQADPNNPDVALPGETLYLEVPFNNSSSSGSHNGGDVMIGSDGKLYFTTGDGWNGGDDVQSLETYTGKVWRLNLDGSIPTDNPFYNEASGDFQGIYALGLRNPYSFSNLSPTDQIYINDAVGADKASVFLLSPGYNYGHDGYSGIGTSGNKWANMSVNNAKVITGGAWYPSSGYWPEPYRESYFAAFWGSNSSGAPGHITRAPSESDPNPVIFYDEVIIGGELKPAMLKMGPDENLYYCMTDYVTGDGEIYRIRYTDMPQAATPSFSPPPGQYDDPQMVAINGPDSSIIYYTVDGSDPDSTSMLYVDSISVDSSLEILAIAYRPGYLPSQVASGAYTIGPIPNIPPVADAGPDLFVEVNTVVTLNGSGTYDPDGNSVELQESWKQIGGDSVEVADSDETVANFTPTRTGYYAFQILAEDIYGARDSDVVVVQVVATLDDYLNCLIARWSFEEGVGETTEDSSPNNFEGTIEDAMYMASTADSSNFSLAFNSSTDRVDFGSMDIYSDQVTFTFWAYLNSYETSDARFISKADGQFDSDHFWMVSTLNNSRLRFRLNTSEGGTSTLTSNTGVVPLNEWIHITAVYDGSEMRLYKNAQMVTSMSKSGVLMTDPFVDVAVGNQPGSATGGTRHLDGKIDEMRIYGCALDSAQISRVYLSNYATYCYDTLDVPDVVEGVDLYEASNKIKSSAVINSNRNIIFSAEEGVELVWPFEVKLGGGFVTRGEGCE
jgi:glucose/arabinose dehydrogenase